MSERRTIADSKREFHKSFPYVIPPLYRRIADELLVELHLLGHQKSFKHNILFSLGLKHVFNSFTLGYKPEEHLKPLFDSLCKSNGFDPAKINSEANKAIERAKLIESDKVESIITNEFDISRWQTEPNINNNYYTRLMAIGLLTMINNSSKDKPARNQQELDFLASIKLSSSLGMPEKRVEKDINLFNSNIEKLKQAVELMNEAVISEKRKREKVSNKEEIPKEDEQSQNT